jgi:hypothetical protein
MDEISAGLGTAGAQAAPETGRNGTPGADMATGASRTGSLSAGEGSMGQKNGWAELETAGAQLRESLLTQRSRAGEDAAWQAEQLDQIFRRDSRRYDGGFFLY